MTAEKRLNFALAAASLMSAVALAFTALIIRDDHDIAAGVCLVCAQLLVLVASILGIDYKITKLLNE